MRSQKTDTKETVTDQFTDFITVKIISRRRKREINSKCRILDKQW